MITLYTGRLVTKEKYPLCQIDIAQHVYDKHIKEGLTEKEIQDLYIQKYKERK